MSAAAPDLRGLVDNATADCFFGWVWNAAAPGERLGVELRLDERVLLAARADLERADLAGAGIGDGRHAFMLQLPREAQERRGELSVVARASDGVPVPIPMRIARTRPAAVAAGTTRPDGAAREVVARDAARVAVLERQVGEITERLDTMALWLERLDRRGAEAAEVPPPRPRFDAWQVGVALILLLAAGAALALVAGFGR